MIVFNTVLKILNKLKGMLIIYTVMLISITAFNQSSTNINSYEETKPDILIVNKDQDNSLTKEFINYLDNHSNIKDIDNYTKEDIDDAIFYRDIDLVLYIPSNFGNDILIGNNPKIDYKASNNEGSTYSIMLVEKYLKTIDIYKDYYSKEDLSNIVKNTLDKEVKVEVNSTLDSNNLNRMTTYFNFLNYAFLAGCVYIISMTLASLKEEHVLKRTIVSSYNYKKYNRIVLLSNALVIFILWILYMLLSLIIFKDLLLTKNGLLFIINSFIFSICSLTIGFLIGNITSNKNALGGIVNVVAVGASFLCGAFVPMEYMSNNVLNIAHILPSYYYILNNEIIKGLEIFTLSNIKPLIINSLVIFIFSIIFIIITNYISKKRQIIK